MTPTLFSVSYAGLWGQCRLDVEAFVAKAAALGYCAVEIMGKRPHLSIVDSDRRSVDRLRQTAAAAGVEIATIAGYTNFTLGRDSEIPAVEIQVAYVRELRGWHGCSTPRSSGSSPATSSRTMASSLIGTSACAACASARRWLPSTG